MLLHEGLINLELVQKILRWRHTGFNVHTKVRTTTKRKEEKCDETFITPLFEVVEDQSSEQSVVFGESLPSGLVLKSGERCFREDKQL